ncbi:hypothetical protein CALCODRAFT_513673, partial [Calocera cornea HHB12733]
IAPFPLRGARQTCACTFAYNHCVANLFHTPTYTKGKLWPANPSTARGASTMLSSSGSKIIYTNGATVIIHDLEVHRALTWTAGMLIPSRTLLVTAPTLATFSLRLSLASLRWDTTAHWVMLLAQVWVTVGARNILKNEVKVGFKMCMYSNPVRTVLLSGGPSSGVVFTFDTGNSASKI